MGERPTEAVVVGVEVPRVEGDLAHRREEGEDDLGDVHHAGGTERHQVDLDELAPDDIAQGRHGCGVGRVQAALEHVDADEGPHQAPLSSENVEEHLVCRRAAGVELDHGHEDRVQGARVIAPHGPSELIGGGVRGEGGVDVEGVEQGRQEFVGVVGTLTDDTFTEVHGDAVGRHDRIAKSLQDRTGDEARGQGLGDFVRCLRAARRRPMVDDVARVNRGHQPGLAGLAWCRYWGPVTK